MWTKSFNELPPTETIVGLNNCPSYFVGLGCRLNFFGNFGELTARCLRRGRLLSVWIFP